MSVINPVTVTLLGSRPKPFLKWAGGKGNLLHQLHHFVPEKYNTYIEPFVGGGAFFFDLYPPLAILSDSNPELMNAYRVVRDDPDELLRLLELMPVNAETFYRIRGQNPRLLTEVERAARTIYLNKTCYNGLYRVNKQGQFNAPFGQYLRARVCDHEGIYAASRALKGVELLDGDFEPILLNHARNNDFIYLDPPYPPIGRYSDFKRYTKEFFGEADHLRLANVVEELDRRGSKFVLSNAQHPLVLKLYSKFKKTEVKAPRFINCRGDKRGNVSELLVTNI